MTEENLHSIWYVRSTQEQLQDCTIITIDANIIA